HYVTLNGDDDKVVEGPDGSLVWQSPNPDLDGQRYIPLIGGEDGLASGNYLEHGGLYYVMAPIDQFNLVGDNRLAKQQVIQLGALENETRGGIARIKFASVDPAAEGFTLSVNHILDS